MGLTYHISTIGCQMNDADSRYLTEELERLGYVRAPRLADADVAVINTCVVRQQAEDRVYGQLNELLRLKRARPEMTVALIGCLVGVKGNPGLPHRFPFVDVFAAPSQPEPLLDYLANKHDRALRDELTAAAVAAVAAVGDRGGMADRPSAGAPRPAAAATTAYVPAVLGCSHACTFCVIPYRRGPEHSRPTDEILTEVRELTARGVREVTLLGQIIDRYGLDLPDKPDLAGLLRAVAGVEGLCRVRFLTSHPDWMTDALLDTVASVPKICPHIEVAAQSGDDEVLGRMRRGYTAARFRALVERVRERIPDVAVQTDIIVGFPGETEEQFMRSYRLLEELRFDKVHLARYSVRPKTYAATAFADDVPEEEKARRLQRLEELQTRIQQEKNEALVGETVEVLVEDRRKDRWCGRTPQNRLVFFADEKDHRGKLVDVTIVSAGPFSLVGTMTKGSDRYDRSVR